ncbi:MAG: anthranilate phosphoribosyltransferase [Candidatus Tectomicrobia bacterium RIFCSPLOWO2_12_FULL_69_37]|nr:MAG: anthranilate phosphoribosyltransferase [Candidatus Tectomicrobia bacterium RIFCSPLOWO2_02_FULL_70_19]OGL67548.1 MAG: anthranilate phosphoribosyltransferase [Candidatus Tectomicrobia bacterium RIFCSPLOWO2_12_FULL_69_37]
MIQQAIGKLVQNQHLSAEEAERVMDQIMTGEATPAQIGGYLVALRMAGETPEEIAGSVRSMRAKATRVPTRHPLVVDTCGTGGDGARTFNISTTAAFAVAGAGLPVAKHGNRSVSSQCGSADVLKALGVNIEAPPERVGKCLDEAGFGFLFAPALHGAMRHAIGPRRELAMRSIFNIMGPLTNPAGAQCQIVGVYAAALTELVAEVLGKLGARRALAVHGHDGMDEMTLTGPTRVSEWDGRTVRSYDVRPEDAGLKSAPAKELAGGDPAANAEITRKVLAGEKGPRRDVVLLNAAAALLAGSKAGDLKEGVELAARSLDSGAARRVLDKLVELSNA